MSSTEQLRRELENAKFALRIAKVDADFAAREARRASLIASRTCVNCQRPAGSSCGILCLKCCLIKKHNHCTRSGCKRTSFCEGHNKCGKCCTTKGHGHSTKSGVK